MGAPVRLFVSHGAKLMCRGYLLESAWKILDGLKKKYAEKNPSGSSLAFFLSHTRPAPSHSLGFSLSPPLSPCFLYCNRFSLETCTYYAAPTRSFVPLTAAEAQGRAKPVGVTRYTGALCAKKMRVLVAASLWAVSAVSPSSVEAALVDAGALTSVAVEAPLYDANLSDARGCDPAGCVGELSRVRDRGREDL